MCVKVHDCLGSGAPWQKMCHYICEKPPYSTQIMLCQPLRFASISSHIFLISNFRNKCVYMVMGLPQDGKKVFPLHCVCVGGGGGGRGRSSFLPYPLFLWSKKAITKVSYHPLQTSGHRALVTFQGHNLVGRKKISWDSFDLERLYQPIIQSVSVVLFCFTSCWLEVPDNPCLSTTDHWLLPWPAQPAVWLLRGQLSVWCGRGGLGILVQVRSLLFVFVILRPVELIQENRDFHFQPSW